MLFSLRSLAKHRYLLGFGFLLAFLSGSGQTYFISLFGGEIRNAFTLTNAEFGGLYSAATLVSGVLVIWLGRGVDQLPLPVFTTGVMVGAAVGAIALATAPGALWLLPAFLLLRLCGQGLMTHVAQTTVGRRVTTARGTAIGAVTLGMPAGEAVLPALAVALMAGLGWRGGWWVLAALLVGVALPACLVLLRLHARVPPAVTAPSGADEGPAAAAREAPLPVPDWTREAVLRDARFYRILPALLAPPFLVTALFFHQVPIAAAKGWTLAWLSTAFVFFALTHVLSLALSGTLVDRLGAPRLLRLYLLPMLGALMVLGFLPGDASAILYLGLAGISVGAAGTLMGALWPELYGVRHLGAIRAMAHGAMVLSTAAAPVLVGVLLDAGVSVRGLALMLVAYVVAGILLIPPVRTLTAREPGGQASG